MMTCDLPNFKGLSSDSRRTLVAFKKTDSREGIPTAVVHSTAAQGAVGRSLGCPRTVGMGMVGWAGIGI